MSEKADLCWRDGANGEPVAIMVPDVRIEPTVFAATGCRSVGLRGYAHILAVLNCKNVCIGYLVKD